MKLLSLAWADSPGTHDGNRQSGRATHPSTATTVTTGVTARANADGRAGSATSIAVRAAPTSATATPASRYRHRYQKGSSRAFHNGPSGTSRNPRAAMTARAAMAVAVRRRSAIPAMAPARASAVTNSMCDVQIGVQPEGAMSFVSFHGKSHLMYAVVRSHPMLVV